MPAVTADVCPCIDANPRHPLHAGVDCTCMFRDNTSQDGIS